jgi:uncharacterized integral membrane protein
MNVKLAVLLALAVLVIVFLLQNLVVVEIRFLIWSLPMSRALFMLIFLAVGFISGWLIHSLMLHRRNRPDRP